MRNQQEKFSSAGKRGRVPTSQDPFISEEALAGVHICPECHAVYQQRHWNLSPELYEQARRQQHRQTTCPACLKAGQAYAEGVVTLSGEYLWEHETEICNLIRNAENQALENNPLERVIRMERQGEGLVVETTDIKLAEHLGRIIHRAHQGELRMTWSGSPSTCRVSWQRQN